MSKQLSLGLPSPSQLKQIGRVLSFKEKFLLYSAVLVLLGSLLLWAVNFYLTSTQKVPDFGGEYTEGMVGEPLYINPIIAQSNEVDAAMSQLLFSSLLKYDPQGNLINDLAQEYSISEDGKTYTLKIRQGVKWHDKSDLTAQDVLFTINLIKDPGYKSSLRGDWQDVQVNSPDDFTITFQVEQPYAPFLNKLTFGVLPRHLFQDVSPDKFLLSDLNRRPIGSGPFVFADFKTDNQDNVISYQLLANHDYYHGRPFLDKLNFNFYPDEDTLLEAYNRKEVNGLSVISYHKIEQFKNRKDSQLFSIRTPRYFAVFFNELKSKPLANDNIRKAISFGTNRQSIIQEIFAGYATEISSPILKEFGQFSSNPDAETYPFDLDKAKQILEDDGWKTGEDGIRAKDNQKLEISLVTTQWPDLVKTAELLTQQWSQIGIRVTVENLSITDIQQNFIKPREYQSMLFGQEYFGNDPDPYYFWHSSGKKDPGRNIAVYDNQEVDKLLESARTTNDLQQRKDQYAEFEKKLTADAPAVFLYSPNFVYLLNKKIQGIQTTAITNPAIRFADATHWFIKTKRISKETREASQ